MADRTTRAIGYIRVATPTDTHAQKNIEIQAQRIREYCHINNLLIAGTFSDEGASGNKTAREGLQSALSALRQGQADVLIVTSTSRLTRSVTELAALIDEHFANGSRALVSIKERLDTRTSSGKFMFGALRLISRLGGR